MSMARAVTSCLVALVLAGTTLLLAQTPPCGTVINTTGTAVTFDSDMVCPVGFADTALTIEADDVVVDGAGYSIVAPTAIRGVYAKYASNVAIRNLASVDSEAGIFLLVLTNSEVTNVDFSGSGGTGLHVAGGSGLLIVDNTAHGRQEGIRIAGSTDGNTYRDNNLSDNAYGIVSNDSSPRTGSSYINNDISRSTNVGMWLAAETGLTLSGNNFTDAASGILFWYMDSFTFADWDFSVWNIPGVAVWMGRSTNSTIRNINASGSGGTGVGIRVVSSSGMLVADNIVHGRAEGIRIAGSTDANTYQDNDLSDNAYGIVSNDSSARTGSSYINNDVSRSSAIGMWLAAETGLTLSGNNFTDAASGIHFWYMDSFTFSDRDFSVWNIPGTAVGIGRSTNSTIRNIDASGSGGIGKGIRVVSSSGMLVADNIVHGRQMGIRIEGSTSGNSYTGNDLTDNAYAVSSVATPMLEAAFVDNDLSRSSLYGMVAWYGAVDPLIRGNIFSESATGVFLADGEGAVVAANEFAVTGGVGIKLSGHADAEIMNNLIIDGSGRGLEILDSPGTRVYHNNIFGQQSWQAFADDPIELSYSNEGNYWGRACPGPLFIELDEMGDPAWTERRRFDWTFDSCPQEIADSLESNALGVVDSNPYGVFDGWLVGADPGCGPPPPGSIAGEVRDNFSGVPSVVVSLTDSGGLFLRETSTGADGGYGFSEVEPGLFGVSIIVPIGYAPASATDVEATVNSDEETTVDFLLERLVLAVDPRGLGYWKHQAKANLTGRGHAHESASDLLDYLGSVQDQYDIFDHVVGLAGLLDELDPPKPATMRERAEQHLMTLLLNLASLRIATYTVISYDDTAGEAIDYILETLGDAGSNKTELEAIKDLAEDINEGRIPLDPDRIPEPLE